MKRKLALLVMLVMLISACVLGCKGTTTTPPASTSAGTAATTAPNAGTATATPEPVAGPTTVVVRLAAVANTLDNYRAKSSQCGNFERLLYNFILGENTDTGLYQLENGVLESYDVKNNDDGTCTLTLTIRDDIFFHDGSKLTGEDIIFSLEQFRDLSTTGSQVFNYMTGATADGNVITVQLSQPHAQLIQSLTACRVQCKATFEKYGDVEALNVCNGTGPYTLVEYVAGSSVICKAWPDYHDGEPAIDTVKFVRIDDLTAAYMSLESGDVDFTTIAYQDVARAEENENLAVYSRKVGTAYELYFNCDLEMFSDVNMRKAFCHACNKETYQALNPAFFVNDSAINDTSVFYYSAPDQPTYDPEKAAQLFTSLGVTPENRMAVTVTSYSGDPLAKIMEAYQLDLKTYGVDLSIELLEYGAWVDAQDLGEFELETNSWTNGTPSAYSLCKYYATAGIPGINNQRFRDARMDEIFTELTICTDLDRQKELAKEVQTIAAANVPKFPLYGITSYFAYDKDISNVLVSNSNAIYLQWADRTQIDQ